MSSPSKILLGSELIRAIYEYGLGWAFSDTLQNMSPKGDGHPVMIIPGLGTSDGSTHYMRNFLGNIGYTPYTWGLGRNLGPRNGFDALMDQLVDRVNAILDETGKSEISLVGWSLGGIYAREISKKIPHSIRQVITLGTPFKGQISEKTNASALYEFLSKDKSHKDPGILRALAVAPDVPFTSLYSKTDGVVHWECSIEDPGPKAENVEIPGASHLGMGHNPAAMYVIADRLTYNKSDWVPFASSEFDIL
jgi:pimeloyl-ACP methyl ester carboxylesterase